MPERVFTATLFDDLFPVIGMPPALGRGFTREELAPNGPPVAIISDRLWQSRFGRDPQILNRPIRIGGQAAAIVGVMPPGLTLIGTDLWIPWGGDPGRVPRNVRQLTIVARVAPNASLTQANAELASIAGRVEQARRRGSPSTSIGASPRRHGRQPCSRICARQRSSCLQPLASFC